MGKHTIETLTKDLNNFKKYVVGEFNDLKPQVTEMHDFIVDQKGFERGQKADVNQDGTIRISKDVFGLILKLVVLASALAGIKIIQG